MSSASRRIVVYSLLLLVPALFVGGGAIYLLQRERDRLAESSAEVEEARRATLATRARLIAENVELLLGDAQTGLLDTLAAAPAGELDSFFTTWEQTNPLVRIAFRSRADGRLLRPEAGVGDEEARGFHRRFARALAERPPWGLAPAAAPPAVSELEKKIQADESLARKEVTANVAQVRSARRDVQQLFRPQGVEYANEAGASAPAGVALADSAARARANLDERRRSEADGPAGIAVAPAAGAARYEAKAEQFATALQRQKDAGEERRGWLPLTIDGRLHVLGWAQSRAEDEVRGVELELAALIGRLGDTLPVELASGEGFALRDGQGRVLHQAGSVPRTDAPAVRIPLASVLLPGWDVVGFLAFGPGRSAANGAFFGASVLLVGIFVAAILAGGALLLWQARRSELEAAQKTSFVANVSHEFKTPLTTIRLYAELLEQGRVRDAAQGGDYLRTIGRETQRLARLVNNALDFSRLEQGKKKYARETFDLAAELARLLDTHAPRVAEAGLALKRELPASPLSIASDRDALEQVVLNLIDNACKYAAEGGEVAVTARAMARGGAEVRVADRGPGVPPEHRERIFEKFHRVDDALTAEKTGAGLGLSIARQLARGLGGELRYTPRAGGGAEFVVELP